MVKGLEEVKMGRPRKEVDDHAQGILRKYWRKHSARYYKKHRTEVLERARKKVVKEENGT